VVYVNNFLPDEQWTVDIAGLAFVHGQQRSPARRTACCPAAIISFEYREFLLFLPDSIGTGTRVPA